MKRQRTTSFQTIKTDILERIRNHEWSPGETIPGEESIAQEYGCSRATVNRAIRELADSGIVERRRKAGTRVVHQPARAARVQIPIVRKEIEQQGSVYRYVLLERIEKTAPENIRAKMTMTKKDKALHIRCLHYADETPYQYEDRWINLVAVPLAQKESFTSISPNEWLVLKQPWSEAEHAFSAVNATPEQAALFEINPNDALFVVERRTWSEQHTITTVKLFHPGASFRMVSRT